MISLVLGTTGDGLLYPRHVVYYVTRFCIPFDSSIAAAVTLFRFSAYMSWPTSWTVLLMAV